MATTFSDVNKNKLLQALEKSNGVLSHACKAVGLARSTHYDWMKADPDYKAAVEELGEVAIDVAETALFKNINKGKEASIIFFLKTRARKRGYEEKLPIEFPPGTGVVILPSNGREISQPEADMEDGADHPQD